MKYYFPSQRKLHVNGNLVSCVMLRAPPTSASLFWFYYNYRKTKKSHIDKEKTPVYRFPADPVECTKWMKSLPYQNLKTNKDSFICQKYWPTSFDTVSKKGKLRPRDPPI